MDRELALQLLRWSNSALRDGHDRAEIDRVLREETGGPGLEEIKTFLRENPVQPESGFIGARDGARMVAQGLLFGFADELAGVGAGLVPGGQTRQEATAASRERLAQIRQDHPGQALVAEGAGAVGSFFLPGGAARLPFLGARVAPLAQAIGQSPRIAATLEGAAVGAGESDGDLRSRARGAVQGGAVGFALGQTGRVVAPAVRRSRDALSRLPGGEIVLSGQSPRLLRTGDEVAERLGSALGSSPAQTANSGEAVLQQLREEVQVSRSRIRLHGPVEDTAVLRALEGPEVFSAAREVMGEAVSERVPTLEELAQIRDRLQGETRRRFQQTLNRRVPEFPEAEIAMRTAQEAEQAFARGRLAVLDPGARPILSEHGQFPADNEHFRAGVAVGLRDLLAGGEALTAAQLEQLQGAGLQNLLSQVFRSAGAARVFTSTVRNAGQAVADAEKLRPISGLLKLLGLGAGGGIGVGLLRQAGLLDF